MWSLRPIVFDDVPGWAVDDHGAARAALARHRDKPVSEIYRTGCLGIAPQLLLHLAEQSDEAAARADPRGFFEQVYTPVRLRLGDGSRGCVTGFYEPIVAAARERKPPFLTPLYSRPPDLVSIDPADAPASVQPGYRFGRQLADGQVVAYPDRREINVGALEGMGLEIAFLADPVDAFFIHIQGAARLQFDDGETIRITYDGKSGHPFTAIGKLLVERGELTAGTVSMMAIRRWLADHKDHARSLMEENRSFIFFRQSPANVAHDGPVAAAKIPLTAGRSLAVDRLIHTFATPIFVTADQVNGKPWQSLMIAQETGTAIVGPARGDIFFGSGDKAGELAGAVNSPCDFIVLVPNQWVDRLPKGLHS